MNTVGMQNSCFILTIGTPNKSPSKKWAQTLASILGLGGEGRGEREGEREREKERERGRERERE